MFGRDVRTRFAQLLPPTISEKIDDSHRTQLRHHNGRRNETFGVGDQVMIRDYRDVNHPSWSKAIIDEVLGQREYVCRTEYGKFIKRHLDQILSFAEIQSPEINDIIKANDVHDRSNVPDADGPPTSDDNHPELSNQNTNNEGETNVEPPRRIRPKRNIKPVQRYVAN